MNMRSLFCAITPLFSSEQMFRASLIRTMKVLNMLATKRSAVFLATISFATLAGLAGCKQQDQAAPKALPPTEVSVYTVKLGEHIANSELTGRAHAYREAVVRPQVNGVLQKRLYTEGTEVKQGQQLYQIDAAPYEAALASAEAQLAQAKSQLVKAKADAARSTQLLKINAVSKQSDDAAQAALRQATAQLKAAEASVTSAKVNLNYTRVTSPISGLAGRSEFTEGALMSGYQSQELTTVTQLDPMYVDVTQSAEALLALKAQVASGQLKTDKDGNAKVTLTLPDGTAYAHEGKLTFRGVMVDETTGSVNLRMEFPNPERTLMPGLFVKAKIEMGGVPNSTLVSMQALMHDAKGNAYVYLVNKDNKIERRDVNVVGSIGSQWLVNKGLNEGDKVVFDGFSRIAPGKQVVAKEGNPTQLQEQGNKLFN